MISKRQFYLPLSGLLLLVLVAAMVIFKQPLRDTIPMEWLNSRDRMSEVRHQRNSLSRTLNALKQNLGQQECTVAMLQNSKKVSSSGGFCKEESEKKGKHMTDFKLAAALGKFLTGQRVGGFGDGPGHYLKYFLEQGLVASWESYDGAPFSENVTDGAVKFMDLTIPQYGFPVYDWVVCLEVAEHVPAQYELVLVDNIARHARYGIVLSWGHPGQGGFHHVNNKSPEDVKRLLDDAGFRPDEKAGMSLRNSSVFGWFKENTFVFRRKEVKTLVEEDA